MLQSLGEKNFIVLSVLVFTSCLLPLESVYFLWKSYRGTEARKLSRRVQALGSGKADDVSKVQVVKAATLSNLPALDRWLAERSATLHIRRFLQQADTSLTLSQLAMASLATSGLGFLATPESNPLGGLLVLAMTLLGVAVPWVLVAVKRWRRLEKIRSQFPDALDFITRSLRSGQALTSAIMLAGEELRDPIATEFRAMHDEITFGESFEKAMLNFGERLPLTDLRYFVVSVLVQRDSGGNLSEILDGLSRLIRERYKLMSKIRILSADGRLSAVILVIAPFALGPLMNHVNPEFMSLLWTDPIGTSIVQTLAVLMVVGIVILRHITRIRV